MAHSNALVPANVLVIDDEPDLRTLYEMTLLREGFAVDCAADLRAAWDLLEQKRFDLVITDMRLPDGLGTDLLLGLRAQQRAERCIVITAYGSAENAVESLKAGAFDYLTKPVDLKQFRSVVAMALQVARSSGADPSSTSAAADTARSAPRAAGAAALARLVGDSPAMRGVRERVAKVARSMAPVMVHGESGTGKELVAAALHANSHRSEGPWIAVNCGAIPENLLEAEFFGVKKGAYTGATSDRPGFFQAAHGGTLFLDEIGDLPVTMQAKLLRAIQERRIRPLGANQEEAVDVRLISATHKDVRAEVAAGRFRQDLFYRLHVIDIELPALRERIEDLPALCHALLTRIAAESGARVRHLTPQALAALACQPLRGNVRELENILHRALALCEDSSEELEYLPQAHALDEGESQPLAPTDARPEARSAGLADAADAAPTQRARPALPSDLQAHLDEQEREILVRALRETGFNRTVAARQLGLSLRQIRYRIARLKIDAPDLQDDDRNG